MVTEQKEVEALGVTTFVPFSKRLHTTENGYFLLKQTLTHLIESDNNIKTIQDLTRVTGLEIGVICKITNLSEKELFEILLQKQGVWWMVPSSLEVFLFALGEA